MNGGYGLGPDEMLTVVRVRAASLEHSAATDRLVRPGPSGRRGTRAALGRAMIRIGAALAGEMATTVPTGMGRLAVAREDAER